MNNDIELYHGLKFNINKTSIKSLHSAFQELKECDEENLVEMIKNFIDEVDSVAAECELTDYENQKTMESIENWKKQYEITSNEEKYLNSITGELKDINEIKNLRDKIERNRPSNKMRDIAKLQENIKGNKVELEKQKEINEMKEKALLDLQVALGNYLELGKK